MSSISVDCVWGDWIEGDCSTTCGTGEQTDTRVKLIEEANGGTCVGDSSNVSNCTLEQCRGMS